MVSIKSILRQKIESKMDVFIRAMKIQMYLDHPNIAKIYGIVVDEKYVHLII
jgi:serine/threonine protein kinase